MDSTLAPQVLRDALFLFVIPNEPYSSLVNRNFTSYICINIYLHFISLRNYFMRTLILALALILGISPNVRAAVQTDTHTYIVSKNDNAVLAINRQTGEKTKIPVGNCPQSMVIHGDRGYVVNYSSNSVSVINLETNYVSKTIDVGVDPKMMVIYGKYGYVVNRLSDSVSVIDLAADKMTGTIIVGHVPASMVINGGLGYVVNRCSHSVSVINLQTNKVIETINVGEKPQFMGIHRGIGYVLVSGSSSIVLVDLKEHAVIKTINVGKLPYLMIIYGDCGYVLNMQSNTISVINLETNAVTETIDLVKNVIYMQIHGQFLYLEFIGPMKIGVVDLKTNTILIKYIKPKFSQVGFSETHVYLGLEKYSPLYPTLASVNLAKEKGTLGEFVAMMPEVFQLGEIEPRLFPKEENVFDTVPPYALAQEIFWDLKTGKPLMDPEDILATLVTMKYPQRFLKTEAGVWLRKRLHMAFFQAVWVGDLDKAKAMLTYFVQLQDPVITSLATYTFKGATQGSDQKATNSTELN